MASAASFSRVVAAAAADDDQAAEEKVFVTRHNWYSWPDAIELEFFFSI